MNTTTHENLVILFTYLVLVLCDVFMYGLRRLSRVEVILVNNPKKISYTGIPRGIVALNLPKLLNKIPEKPSSRGLKNFLDI